MAVVLLVRPLVDPVIDSVNEPIEIMKVEFRTADDRRTDKRMNFSLQSACTEKAPNGGQPCSEWQKSSPAPKTMTRQRRRRHFTQQRSYFTCHIRETEMRMGDHVVTYYIKRCNFVSHWYNKVFWQNSSVKFSTKVIDYQHHNSEGCAHLPLSPSLAVGPSVIPNCSAAW